MGELRFRDGKRTVPDYLEELMASFDTKAMTYDEAIRAANRKLEGDFVARAQEGMIRSHFQRQRDG